MTWPSQESGGIPTARWRGIAEAACVHITEAMLEMTQIGQGARVLVFGRDSGILADAAARRTGNGCVTAAELAPGSFRTQETVEEEVGEKEAGAVAWRRLDFEDMEAVAETFDVVLCPWTLAGIENPEPVVAAMVKLLHPGGWLAVSAWAEPSRMPLHGVALDAFAGLSAGAEAKENASLAAVLTAFAGRMRAGNAGAQAGRLAGILEKAGLSTVEEQTMQTIHVFTDAEECAACWLDHVFPGAEGPNLPAPARQAAFDMLAEGARVRARPDRSVRIVGEAMVAAGQNAVRQYF